MRPQEALTEAARTQVVDIMAAELPLLMAAARFTSEVDRDEHDEQAWRHAGKEYVHIEREGDGLRIMGTDAVSMLVFEVKSDLPLDGQVMLHRDGLLKLGRNKQALRRDVDLTVSPTDYRVLVGRRKKDGTREEAEFVGDLGEGVWPMRWQSALARHLSYEPEWRGAVGSESLLRAVNGSSPRCRWPRCAGTWAEATTATGIPSGWSGRSCTWPSR